MRLLLDTHALYWWLYIPQRLSGTARELISAPDTQVLVSAVTAYEMALKHGLGKWPEIAVLANNFEQIVLQQDFVLLPITARHAARAGALAFDHRDPFDRILAAQAGLEGLTLVSNDARLAALGVEMVWE